MIRVERISVCMATRNGEKYIGRQMESILKQLEDEDEVIVSDDSSTDRTIGIIQNFSDERIKLFEHNTFLSPVYNFENACKKATGENIVLADQDDIWLDNKIEIVRRKLAEKKGQIYTIMMDGEIIDEKDKSQGETLFGMVKVGKGIMKNIYRNCYVGCSMAFTRDLLKVALPFPPHIPMHDSWLGILSEIFGEVEFVPEKTIKYRRHAVNESFRKRSVITQVRWRYFLAYQLLHRYLHLRNRYGLGER